jgi:peroxiredoxin Q/BCP
MSHFVKNIFLASLAPLLSFCTACAGGVGKPAPRITARDQDGKQVDFGALYDQGTVLVFFYPKANTPGCTAQACSLRDAYEDLSDAGVTIVGVSTDKAEKQQQFKSQHRLPFALIPDEDKTVIKAFGVPTFFGFSKRQAFLIQKGIVVWYDKSASTSQQAADIKEQLPLLKDK